MAIAVETIATTAMGSGSTITKPTGLTIGDLLLAIVADDQYDFDALAAPAGWTTLGRYTSGDSDRSVEVMVCYIVATATETAASNFTFTNAEGGVLYRISGSVPSLMSQGTGSVYGSQNLVITIGASGDNDSDYSTFSGYSVSGGSSPTMTERFDSYNPAGFRASLGVADGIYNSSDAVTSYNVTITSSEGNDSEMTLLIKIPAIQNATASNALYQTSSVTFATLTGSTQSPQNNLLEIVPEIFEQSGRATNPTIWVNETKPSSTWTNEQR